MSISFEENKKDFDPGKLAGLLRENGLFEGAGPEKIKEAFLNSTYTLFAYEEDSLVGAVRALSDKEAWTLVTDLAVSARYAKKGVGGSLLSRVKAHFSGHEIFTYVALSSLDLFEENGFKRSKNAFTYAGYRDEYAESGLSGEALFLPLGYRYETEFYPVVGDFPGKKKGGIRRENVTLTYEDSLSHVDYQKLNELLSRAFGGHEREEKVTRRTFLESTHVIVAYDGDRIVGCARAISDGVFQGFVLNVATDPEYQGLHIGTQLLARLAGKMRGQNIFLNTHPGGVGFYNRRPFRRNKTALLYPSSPDMPPEIEKEFVLPKGFRFADEYPAKDHCTG